jgi:predicted RNA-binding Zn-ribbon protein involved in translation (DUF1610 family)
MFCIGCGHELPAAYTINFCPNCGKAIKEENKIAKYTSVGNIFDCRSTYSARIKPVKEPTPGIRNSIFSRCEFISFSYC